MPEYPDDILKDIAETRRLQAGQFGSGQTQAPLTEASAGWILRARSTPAATGLGSGDIHIYAKSGKLWVRSASGDEELEQVPAFPKALAISGLSSRQTVSAPGSYSSAWAGNVLADVTSLYTYTQALHSSLIAANLMFAL